MNKQDEHKDNLLVQILWTSKILAGPDLEKLFCLINDKKIPINFLRDDAMNDQRLCQINQIETCKAVADLKVQDQEEKKSEEKMKPDHQINSPFLVLVVHVSIPFGRRSLLALSPLLLLLVLPGCLLAR
jgi:hypothetical protein